MLRYISKYDASSRTIQKIQLTSIEVCDNKLVFLCNGAIINLSELVTYYKKTKNFIFGIAVRIREDNITFINMCGKTLLTRLIIYRKLTESQLELLFLLYGLENLILSRSCLFAIYKLLIHKRYATQHDYLRRTCKRLCELHLYVFFDENFPHMCANYRLYKETQNFSYIHKILFGQTCVTLRPRAFLYTVGFKISIDDFIKPFLEKFADVKALQ